MLGQPSVTDADAGLGAWKGSWTVAEISDSVKFVGFQMSSCFWYLHRLLPVISEALCIFNIHCHSSFKFAAKCKLACGTGGCYFFRLHSLLGEHADSRDFLLLGGPTGGFSDGDGPPKTARGKKCQEASLPSSQGKMKELRDRQILLNAEPLNLSPQTLPGHKGGIMASDSIDILFEILWYVLYARVCHFSIFSKLLQFSC